MSFGDLTRINTNLQALKSYNSLQSTNSDMQVHQMRLATGSRLNRAEDDSAGYTIAKTFQAKIRGQAQAMENIADAKSQMTVAEGGLGSIQDILQSMKEKTVQANNDTLGQSERDAIQRELEENVKEIKDVISNTDFAGEALLDGSGGASGAFTFQVGAEKGDTFTHTYTDLDAASASVLGDGSTSLDAMSVSGGATARQDAIQVVDDSIAKISEELSMIGASQKRLSFKYDNLTVSKNNNEATRSRIADANFAKEQMEIAKLQIRQQAGNAALVQANAAPQSVLQLLG